MSINCIPSSIISLNKDVKKKYPTSSSNLTTANALADVTQTLKNRQSEALRLLNKNAIPELRKFSPKETETLIKKLFLKNEKKEINKQKLREEHIKKENKECTFQPEINRRSNVTPPRKLEEFIQEQNKFAQKVESKVKSVLLLIGSIEILTILLAQRQKTRR